MTELQWTKIKSGEYTTEKGSISFSAKKEDSEWDLTIWDEEGQGFLTHSYCTLKECKEIAQDYVDYFDDDDDVSVDVSDEQPQVPPMIEFKFEKHPSGGKIVKDINGNILGGIFEFLSPDNKVWGHKVSDGSFIEGESDEDVAKKMM